MPWVSREWRVGIEERLNWAENRLEKLECPHRTFEFGQSWGYLFPMFFKKCIVCGKVLEQYNTLREYETARIAYEEAKLAIDKKALSESIAKPSRGKKK